MPTQIGKSYLSASEKSKMIHQILLGILVMKKSRFQGGIEMEHWGYMG